MRVSVPLVLIEIRPHDYPPNFQSREKKFRALFFSASIVLPLYGKVMLYGKISLLKKEEVSLSNSNYHTCKKSVEDNKRILDIWTLAPEA